MSQSTGPAARIFQILVDRGERIIGILSANREHSCSAGPIRVDQDVIASDVKPKPTKRHQFN